MYQLLNLISIDTTIKIMYYLVMKITSYKSSIRTIKSDHPAFTINDGIMVSPRAGFEINQSCPKEYRQIIATCIDRGWLKPVANITEKELTLFGLSKI